MATNVKDQKINNFLHTLANQLANANSVEECEEVLHEARVWMNINFTLRSSIH